MCRLPETAGAGIIALDVAGVVAAKKSPATALWGPGRG